MDNPIVLTAPPEEETHHETVPSAPEPLRIAMPIDVRSLALSVLAVLAAIFALRFAQPLFIPLVLSILLGYALEPIVAWFEKRRVPRAFAAALVLIAVVGLVGSLTYSLSDDVTAIVDQLPTAAEKFRERLHDGSRNSQNTIQKFQKAVTEIEKVAAEATGNPPPRPPASSAQPALDLRQYIWWGSLGAVAFAGELALIIFLVYFILLSGNLYKRKLVKLAGPTFGEKKVTVQILDDINSQIERFLFVQFFTSVVAALATWLGLWAVGVEHAGAWGIAAGVGNFIPYVGPIVVALAITVAGFLQFGTFAMAALVAGISLSIKGFVGFVLFPWLMSKAAQMNPVAIFIGLLFWGWVWGMWGVLLAVPMLMVLKVMCDHIENLNAVGELLGE